MEELSGDWCERKHDPISEKVVFPSRVFTQQHSFSAQTEDMGVLAVFELLTFSGALS